VPVRLQFRAHSLVGRASIFAGAIDEMQEHAAAFGVAEKVVAQSCSLMRAFDQSRQIGEHEFTLVDAHHAELWMQRREGIVGDLRFSRTHCGKERGFSGIGQADQARIGDQLQAQTDGAFLAGLAWIGVARGAVGGRLEIRVAEAAVAAFGNGDALADLGEIGDLRLAVFFVDLRADWHLQHDILAVGAGAVLAHAVAAALGLKCC
jgi:hypothetical protein